MPIKVISTIKPNGVALGTLPSPFPTVEDLDILGGFQVQATDTSRNAIPSQNRKQGMLVYVIADGEFYQLAGDLTTWSPASFGSSVTLGGDVTGPSGTNAVVTLSGSAGLVTATAKLATHGRRVNITPTTINYLIVASDDIIAVGTLSAPITITVPASPTTGDIYTVKDVNGSASTYNISISGNGRSIDGSMGSVILYSNYQTVQLAYTGAQWNIC